MRHALSLSRSHSHCVSEDSIDLYPFPFFMNQKDLLVFDTTHVDASNLYSLVCSSFAHYDLGFDESVLFRLLQLCCAVCPVFQRTNVV